MASKFVLAACLVACVRAGNLIQPAAPVAQIRYAQAAPLLTGPTVYHTAPAQAPFAYHASAPAAIAPGPISYGAAPQFVTGLAPAITSYSAPAISYPAALVRAAAPAPTLVAASSPALVRTVASAPAPSLIKAQAVEEYDPNPQYSFGYDVHDSLTGDVKSQVETRSGDVVQGSYALNEPDGTRRIVDYAADSVNGFNAVVRKEPLVQKAIVEAAPVRIAAPAAKIAAAPLAYSAPAPVGSPALISHAPAYLPH